MVKSNIETFIRLKPNTETVEKLEYEIKGNSNIDIRVPDELRKGYVNNLKKNYEFKVNDIFDTNATQEDVYNKIGKKIVKNSIEGYNNTVFCYGQTGGGKTFTMCGSKVWKERGLIPRFIVDLFKEIKSIKDYKYEVYVSYLEIYNENAYDLLEKQHSEIDIENWTKIIVYEDDNNNIILKNLSMIKVDNEHQALDMLMTGNFIRHVSSTPMNLASSRSHAIFSLVLEGKDSSDVTRVSKINLVDLAGSERMKNINNDPSLTNETKHINLSLSFLEQVIIALNQRSQGRSHIPYRNSLMTTILKDSLGGNCKTILIANMSTDLENIEETLSTARFAVRCMKVQNEIKVNEHMDVNILVQKLANENEELKKKIAELQSHPDRVSHINIDKNSAYNYLELKDRDLNEDERDECKIMISDYLKNDRRVKMKAENANQLLFIIDYLLDYLKTKEKLFIERVNKLTDNKKLLLENSRISDSFNTELILNSPNTFSKTKQTTINAQAISSSNSASSLKKAPPSNTKISITKDSNIQIEENMNLNNNVIVKKHPQSNDLKSVNSVSSLGVSNYSVHSQSSMNQQNLIYTKGEIRKR